MLTVQEILDKGSIEDKKALFSFNKEDADAAVLFKFNVWMRYSFPNYFSSLDAPFHKEIDANNLKIYRGTLASFLDIAFRGAAKTARTKLFIAFCIANDMDHSRRYFKVLAEDDTNSIQIVTDIYNMLVRISDMYPEVFQKSDLKREKTMSSFTTFAGVKIIADTVGVNQRGALQEDARPDFIWFEDFENRKTLRSGKLTKTIADNMEEARTGLAKGGGCLYTCNYISELGNVHTLVTKPMSSKKVLIIPIMDESGNPTWERYTKGEIEQMRLDDEDFEGERMCKPSASKDVLFDREMLEAMPKKEPIRTIAGFKIFKEFDPSHRYGSGHDVAGGVGLDSSTSAFIDFDTFPAQVAATFANNHIRPDTFGDEINRQGEYFNKPLAGIERNNHGHATIGRAKQLDVNLYATKPREDLKIMNDSQPKEYGWHTNALTKSKMLFALGKAIADGLLVLNDPALIAEAMSFTRNDLIENEKDPRLTTRHFDLLIAVAIAWQMKDYAEIREEKIEYVQEEETLLYPEIGM